MNADAFERMMNAEGQAIPAVDHLDMRKFWKLAREVSQAAPGQTSSVAIGATLFERTCDPGADMFAVWYRSAMLGVAIHMGLLSRWMPDGEPDEAVFQVMSSFPMKSIGRSTSQGLPFDVDEFLKQVENAKLNPDT